MEKIDFKKKLKTFYQPPSAQAVIIEIPGMEFLMIDGLGDPNTAQAYKDAVETLYAVSYTLKFMLKKKRSSITRFPLWKDCGGPMI